MAWRAVASEGRPEGIAPAAGAARGRTHVCFVAPHAWPALTDDRSEAFGGAEVQQAVLARLFAAAGYRVSMLCLDYGQPPRAAVDGVAVHRLFRMQQGLPLLRFVHPRLSTMWRRLAEVDADIYYYRSASMWVGVVAAFCRRRGKRLVYAGASDKDFVPDQGGQLASARDRWLYRQGLRAADAIVAQNLTQVLTCRGTYGREAVHIPSCYRPPRAGAPRRKDRVLWVGTVYPNKRPELFLELARRLPQRRCVMIGGPRRGAEGFYERMRAEAARLPNVEFTGFLPLSEVEPWFDRARVLVNTSDYEGMPNTFLQAWARGVPTVATVDVGVAVHRVAGDMEALVREVEAAYEAYPSAACRSYFERVHSGENVLAHYARLFDRLCPPDKGGASGFGERGVCFSESETPRSPAAHDPLVRGSAETPRSPAAHDPLVRGSANEERQ